MPNVLNESIHKEYEKLFEGDLGGLFVQPLGLSVADVNAFRTRLAEANLRMLVLKGSLARRVLEARGLSNAGPLFDGPAAVILALEGKQVDAPAIVASKVVAAWRKKTNKDLPAIKGGLLDGALLDPAAATRLEKMPGKKEIQARIAGQIVGPGRKLAAQLIAGGGRIAGAVKTHIANLEKAAPQA